MSEVRVRFAPSPTGYLHLGGARTALFNWLFARAQGGKFILRVEDTDRERHDEASVQAILDSMRWLGLDWDEGPDVGGAHGPYYQSERRVLYREQAEELVKRGLAYRCYATKEQLAAAREAHQASGTKAPFKYPGIWRDRTDWPADQPYVIRFRAPQQGVTGWNDLVKGRIDIPNDTQQDFIILRPDGLPLYNFACVVDDSAMGLTHVIRGDDHVINTPPQILLYEALGKPVPRFAHLPMILAPNGEKLSKRHAAVSVLEYREAGYVPDAVLNYLARLGWSHGDQEIFSLEELKALFGFDHVGRTGARYDAKKFLFVQATHLRQQSTETLLAELTPRLKALPEVVEAWLQPERIETAIRTALQRAQTYEEILGTIRYAFLAEPQMDEAAQAKFLTAERAPHLRALADQLAALEAFDQASLERAVNTWLEAEGLAMKVIAQPARVALTGQSRNAGVYEILELLGADESLKRLRAAAELAEHAG